MTGNWKNYHVPESIEEAVAMLHHYDGAARVIGGGTDLLVEMRRGARRPLEALVDASRMDDLGSIEHDQNHVVIGCGVTHSEIVRHPIIVRYGTCLFESCGVIGGPQVRNVGTLAGNVAHALPAGDGSIGLLALDAEIEITDAESSCWIPVKDAFLGPGKSVIDRRRAVLTRLRFRLCGPREGSAYHRVMRPQGLCLPIISMAARLQLDDNDTITAATIGMGPVGPVPWLAEPAMAELVGGPASTKQFARAAEKALSNVTLRTSKYRASQEYRASMIRTYLPVILARARERALNGHAAPEGIGQ